MTNWDYSEASYAAIKYAYSPWSDPSDEYKWRNGTVEAETDWRYCFPTLNMHQQRSKIEGAKPSFLYYFDAPSDLQVSINSNSAVLNELKSNKASNMHANIY